jgi:hypothetical protein
MRSESEIVQLLGEPDQRERFGKDGPESSYLNAHGSREDWDRSVVSTPNDLLKTISIGTEMIGYSFNDGMPLNPSGAILQLFLDDEKRPIGWVYSREVVGSEASFGFH